MNCGKVQTSKSSYFLVLHEPPMRTPPKLAGRPILATLCTFVRKDGVSYRGRNSGARLICCSYILRAV
jgi:hypothetical protein